MLELVEAWNHGTRLALWGVGFLLVWVSSIRIANTAGWALHERGLWFKPRDRHPALQRLPDVFTAIAGAAFGMAVMFAYTTDVFRYWLVDTNQPYLNVLRLHFGFIAAGYFVVALAPHPRWKQGWLLAWYVFAMVLAPWPT